MERGQAGTWKGSAHTAVVPFVLSLLLPFSVLLTAAASQATTLPEEEPFFIAVRENMARANREQYRYAYKERRAEMHMNPFGRLGTGVMLLYEVMPGPDSTSYIRRLVEKDGKPVTDSKPERQQRRVRSGRSPIDDTVATLKFAIDRREDLDGRPAIVVRFEPRPDADPKTREGKMAKAFKGFIWVDESAREVMRVEATAIDDLTYGMGLLARMHKGSMVTLSRTRIDEGIWLPTSIRFKGNGRALLFRKMDIDYAIEWFDYRKH